MFTLEQATNGRRGSRSVTTRSLISALDGVDGQRHASAALPPGKTRYPLYRRLGGPESPSGQMRKISSPTSIRSPDRPARTKSLYRLSYPGSRYLVNKPNTKGTQCSAKAFVRYAIT